MRITSDFWTALGAGGIKNFMSALKAYQEHNLEITEKANCRSLSVRYRTHVQQVAA